VQGRGQSQDSSVPRFIRIARRTTSSHGRRAGIHKICTPPSSWRHAQRGRYQVRPARQTGLREVNAFCSRRPLRRLPLGSHAVDDAALLTNMAPVPRRCSSRVGFKVDMLRWTGRRWCRAAPIRTPPTMRLERLPHLPIPRLLNRSRQLHGRQRLQGVFGLAQRSGDGEVRDAYSKNRPRPMPSPWRPRCDRDSIRRSTLSSVQWYRTCAPLASHVSAG